MVHRYSRSTFEAVVWRLADLLAYDAPSGLAVAGFDLQRTRHGLPRVRETLPDVQHWDVHEGHLDGPVGPELDVVHGSLVRLDVAAAEQLSGPERQISQR